MWLFLNFGSEWVFFEEKIVIDAVKAEVHLGKPVFCSLHFIAAISLGLWLLIGSRWPSLNLSLLHLLALV